MLIEQSSVVRLVGIKVKSLHTDDEAIKKHFYEMLVLTLATPPQEGVDISVIYTVEMLHFKKNLNIFITGINPHTQRSSSIR